MACAGSAGGSRPPHRNHVRLPGQCEDDYLQDDDEVEDEVEAHPPPPTRKKGQRGCARGCIILKIRKKLGGAKIPITWHPTFPKQRKPVGEYAKNFDSEIGRIMRTRADPNITWEEVPTLAKDQIWAELLSNFTNVRRIHRPAVETQAGVTFRKWKSYLKGLITKHRDSGKPGLCCKPDNVETQEQWERYMRHIDEPYFRERSAQNAENRSKSKWPSTQGRTPLVGYRWTIGQNPLLDPLGRDPIVIWKDTHTDVEGRFVNEYARQAHERLLEIKERIAPNRRATHEEDVQMFEEVFGPRRDSVIGLGPTQSRSQSRQSMSSQMSEDSTSSRAPTQDSMVMKTLKKSHQQYREHSIAVANAYTALADHCKSLDPTIEVPTIPELPLIPELEDSDDDEDYLDEDGEDVDLDD